MRAPQVQTRRKVDIDEHLTRAQRIRATKASIVALAATVLASLPIGLVGAEAAPRIANGTVVPEGSYRFSVALKMTGIPTPTGGRRNSACSGALISNQWIITAATVGRADLNGTNGEVRTVVAVRQLANFDIAVARLDRPVAGIAPIAVGRTAPTIGQRLRLTGYGSVTGTNPVPSTRLLTGQFTVSRVAATTVGVRGFAPAPNTSACPYDSGAPYFTEGAAGAVTLVAIESSGPTCPHAQQETTARIDVAADWIANAIR